MLRFALFHFLFLSVVFFNKAFAISKLDQGVLNEYIKIQKEFAATSCQSKTEEDYRELDLKYRGYGNFIPLQVDQKVDVKSIKNNLPIIKEKIIWIKSQIAILEKLNSFEEIEQTLKRIENEVVILQEAKKDYFMAKKAEKKRNIELHSEKQLIQLKKEMDILKNQATFLFSFKSPLNHLNLRAEYEQSKGIVNKESRSKANNIYLYRKIVQDGSFDKELSRNDSVVRAAFDSLYISLNTEKEKFFLTENERSDFKFVVTNLKNLLSLGQTVLIERLTEWLNRTERSLVFYQDLADGKKIKLSESGRASDIASVLEERARSLYSLKEYVLKKEAESYTYWSKKSDLFQYLYAMETILYAEVGRIDAPDALERRDVGQVVINRYSHPFYSEISRDDSIFEYLPKDLSVKNFKWLNVLFKEGEFSFTYFYIQGNLHIYCPDMSKTGQFLRRENVRIALELLNKPRKNFDALRYFSRMSMFGRIEMDTLWENYKSLEEVPGNPVKNPKKLSTLYKQDRYKFLYDFKVSETGKIYVVVEIKGKTYVIDYLNPKHVFYYRNPHSFRYFAPVK